MPMRRLAFAWLVSLSVVAPAWADAFDHYHNTILAKVPTSKNAEKIERLTRALMVENNQTLPGINASFLVVKTNEGRWAKVLVQPAQQKVSDTQKLPILLLERFTTFREGDERAIVSSGANVRLFKGFRYNLDLGQIVPDGVPADLQFVMDEKGTGLVPLNKAEMYLVTKHFPETNPKKNAKLEVGDVFQASYFTGTYKLYDDGRRSGELSLQVDEKGNVLGHYFSDKDGKKYDVEGKVGNPNHSISFSIQFPRTLQFFNGWLFTGDARTMTGTSRLLERETGFYAVRKEE